MAGDPQAAPPAYGDVIANGGGREQIVLLSEQDQTPLLDRRAPESKRFSMQNFVLQWFGIGYGYSFFCFIFSLLLFGGGVAVIILTAVAGDGLLSKDCEPLQTAKGLTLVAGSVVILLATLWPLVWFWHQSNRRRSFTPFLCYSWLLSLLYFGILCALAVQVYEHHDILWPWHTKPDTDNCDHQYSNQIPLWTFASMGGMMSIFIVVSCIACCCFAGAGSIW